MSTLLNKNYFVKVSTKGERGSNKTPNSVYVVCTQPKSLKKYCLYFLNQIFLVLINKNQLLLLLDFVKLYF